jgi:hypothetical protein
MKDQLFKNQVSIKVNVIQVHEWKNSRIGARSPEVPPDVGAFKMRGHEARNKAASPLVEVSEHDAGSLQLIVRQNIGRDQLPALCATLKQRGTEVNVEDMKHLRIIQTDIDPQTPTSFTTLDRYVVVASQVDRKSAHDNVAVRGSAQSTVLTERTVESQFFGNKPYLIGFGRRSFPAPDFLKRDDIGIELAQDFDDTGGPDSPVEPPASMDIVGSYAQPFGCEIHGCRSKLQARHR